MRPFGAGPHEAHPCEKNEHLYIILHLRKIPCEDQGRVVHGEFARVGFPQRIFFRFIFLCFLFLFMFLKKSINLKATAVHTIFYFSYIFIWLVLPFKKKNKKQKTKQTL